MSFIVLYSFCNFVISLALVGGGDDNKSYINLNISTNKLSIKELSSSLIPSSDNICLQKFSNVVIAYKVILSLLIVKFPINEGIKRISFFFKFSSLVSP